MSIPSNLSLSLRDEILRMFEGRYGEKNHGSFRSLIRAMRETHTNANPLTIHPLQHRLQSLSHSLENTANVASEGLDALSFAIRSYESVDHYDKEINRLHSQMRVQAQSVDNSIAEKIRKLKDKALFTLESADRSVQEAVDFLGLRSDLPSTMLNTDSTSFTHQELNAVKSGAIFADEIHESLALSSDNLTVKFPIYLQNNEPIASDNEVEDLEEDFDSKSEPAHIHERRNALPEVKALSFWRLFKKAPSQSCEEKIIGKKNKNRPFLKFMHKAKKQSKAPLSPRSSNPIKGLRTSSLAECLQPHTFDLIKDRVTGVVQTQLGKADTRVFERNTPAEEQASVLLDLLSMLEQDLYKFNPTKEYFSAFLSHSGKAFTEMPISRATTILLALHEILSSNSAFEPLYTEFTMLRTRNLGQLPAEQVPQKIAISLHDFFKLGQGVTPFTHTALGVYYQSVSSDLDLELDRAEHINLTVILTNLLLTLRDVATFAVKALRVFAEFHAVDLDRLWEDKMEMPAKPLGDTLLSPQFITGDDPTLSQEVPLLEPSSPNMILVTDLDEEGPLIRPQYKRIAPSLPTIKQSDTQVKDRPLAFSKALDGVIPSKVTEYIRAKNNEFLSTYSFYRGDYIPSEMEQLQRNNILAKLDSDNIQEKQKLDILKKELVSTFSAIRDKPEPKRKYAKDYAVGTRFDRINVHAKDGFEPIEESYQDETAVYRCADIKSASATVVDDPEYFDLRMNRLVVSGMQVGIALSHPKSENLQQYYEYLFEKQIPAIHVISDDKNISAAREADMLSQMLSYDMPQYFRPIIDLKRKNGKIIVKGLKKSRVDPKDKNEVYVASDGIDTRFGKMKISSRYIKTHNLGKPIQTHEFELVLTVKKSTRTIKVLDTTGWADKAGITVTNLNQLLHIRRRAFAGMSRSHIITHGRNGVGRTGTLIAAETMHNLHTPLTTTIMGLKQSRNRNMVETDQQVASLFDYATDKRIECMHFFDYDEVHESVKID